MIKITVETSQKELINSLSENLGEFGDVYLQIESLPYFLSSIPSIRVFQYKINNYPRAIFWYSLDHKILNFLKQSELTIAFPTTLINTKKETITHTFNTINNPKFKPLSDNILDKNTEPKSESELTTTIDQPNLLVKFEDFVKSNDIDSTTDDHNTKKSLIKSSITGFEQYLPNSKPINIGLFLGKFNEKYIKDFKNNKMNPIQDFGDMITRVEKTRLTIKTENNKSKYKVEESKINFLDRFNKYKLQFNTTVSLFLLFSLIAIFNIFPKNIFNVEVSNTIDKKTIEVKIPESQLKKTKVELKSKSQILTSTTQNATPKNLSESFQKVNLVNNSNGTVRFDQGGIILIAEKTGVEYRHKITAEDLKTFSIPKQNSKNFIRIEPTKPTEALPNGSILKVFNLKGEALGYNFKAIVEEESNPTKQNIFTNSDQDTLETIIESDLNEKRSSLITSINDENNFTDPSWFTIISNDIKYDKKLNDNTDVVNAEALSVIEVYSIPRNDFKKYYRNQIKPWQRHGHTSYKFKN
jgi:hypothetical protein